MSPRNFRKISHPELELSLYLYNISKEVSQLIRLTDLQEFQNYLELACQHTRNVKKNSEISHPEQDISLYMSNFSEEVSQLME